MPRQPTIYPLNPGHDQLIIVAAPFDLIVVLNIQDIFSLTDAINRKDSTLVKTLLQNFEIDVKIPLKINLTGVADTGIPLQLAISNLDMNMIKMLVLECGADVNQDLLFSGKKTTPLIYSLKFLAG